jgi:AcrR family transcriptional regulator
MRSSRRRIRPSRSAHGDTSSSSTPNARMASESTTAPATIWKVRSAVMPGRAGRASAGILARRGVQSSSSRRVSTFRSEDPTPSSRVPASFANDVVGRRQVAERADRVREDAAGVSAQACHLVGGGRVVGEEFDGGAAGAEGERARDIRNLVDALRDLERAAADVEQQDPVGRPPVPAAHGQEGEARLVIAGEHLQLDTRLAGDPGEHLLAVRGLADRRGREGEQLLDAGLARRIGRLADRGEDGGHPRIVDRTVGLEVAHEPQHRLVRRLGDRTGARMGLHDEQVHGVGTDVEDPEAHVASVAAAACTRRAFRAYWSDWDDRPTSVGDEVERSHVTRIPASERRTALIEAALRVVSRNGITQATTRAIVAEADMSLASFHYAFDSRDELIDELITTVVEREQQAVIPDLVAGQSLRELLESGLLGYFEHLKADPEHEQAMLELTQYALRSPERHPLALAQYARYAELAEHSLGLAAEHAGVEWNRPVAEVARVLVAFTDGLTFTWLVDRDDAAARAVAHAAADALSRMADPR